jgi:class 3 adenylate cyclase
VALRDDLHDEASEIFRERWTERDGEVVPEPSNLELSNDAVNLEATVLYADMAGSTKLVDEQSPTLAAEVYKAYMACAARIIKDEDGSITAYDGDRVMGVFIGNRKNTTASRTAMKIHWAVTNIINPALTKQYGNSAYQMGHVIGIDTSPVLACRIGVRNDNDLVWVGRAANYAAKLSNLNEGYPIYITGSVFDKLHESAKAGGNPQKSMWEERSWTSMNKMRIYRSNWMWRI